MIGDRESTSIMPQGKSIAQYSVDMVIKKNIKKTKKQHSLVRLTIFFVRAGKDLCMLLKIVTNRALGIMLEISA